jgi:hypothetical protein
LRRGDRAHDLHRRSEQARARTPSGVRTRRHRAGVSALFGYEVAFSRDAPVLHRGGATGSHFDANAKPALLERNALYCVITNYRDDAFAGVLPAARVS